MDENLGMFKAYDIRTKHSALSGEAKNNLLESIARYYAEDAGTEAVILARDARLHCPELMEGLIEALLRSGVDVYVNPLQTGTCQFYYMCMSNRSFGGVMITASHNPAEYVGFKFVGRDCAAIAYGCGPSRGIEKIKEYYINDRGIPSGRPRGSLHYLMLQREFVEYSMKLAGVEKGGLSGMRIFAEFLSGSSGSDFLMAFTEAGADVTVSHLVPDGAFPAGDPNPVVESSIAPARERMRKEGYDLGFCFDGDGDRMDLMFPDGTQIIPGLNMSAIIPYIRPIFAPYFDPSELKCFVDVKAIPLAVIEIAKSGIEPHIIRNGHSFIKEKLLEHKSEGYVVSEEESAHYYMNFPVDLSDPSKGLIATENTLFFALLSARAYKENREKYERIHRLQEGIHRFREWPLNFTDPSKMERIMADVEAAMRARGATVIKDMDDGSDLDATLMRFNLPEHFSASSSFPDRWCQVAQRISRSEDAMTRWEVVASDPVLCQEYNDVIKSIADGYVREGAAYY